MQGSRLFEIVAENGVLLSVGGPEGKIVRRLRGDYAGGDGAEHLHAGRRDRQQRQIAAAGGHLCNASGAPADTAAGYPYTPCTMGSGFAGAHAGFDYLDEAVIGGWDAGDLMSYSMTLAKPRWPSDYTYKAIFDKNTDTQLIAAAGGG